MTAEITQNNDSPCALYRHFAADKSLLYVGVSLHPINRTYQHSKAAPWASEIANITIEYLPTRTEALIAEMTAIKEESPKYNVKHRVKVKPQPLVRSQAGADSAKMQIVRRLVEFSPLYKVVEAGKALGVSSQVVNQEIAAGRLSCAEVISPRTGRVMHYVTGWQLIDWLESREATASANRGAA